MSDLARVTDAIPPWSPDPAAYYNYEFGYDGLGRRVWTQQNSTSGSWFIYDGDQLVQERDFRSDALIVEYAWGPTTGAPAIFYQRRLLSGTPQERWIYTSPQGGFPRHLFDDTGVITDTFQYSSFGELVFHEGSTEVDFGSWGYSYVAVTTPIPIALNKHISILPSMAKPLGFSLLSASTMQSGAPCADPYTCGGGGGAPFLPIPIDPGFWGKIGAIGGIIGGILNPPGTMPASPPGTLPADPTEGNGDPFNPNEPDIPRPPGIPDAPKPTPKPRAPKPETAKPGPKKELGWPWPNGNGKKRCCTILQGFMAGKKHIKGRGPGWCNGLITDQLGAVATVDTCCDCALTVLHVSWPHEAHCSKPYHVEEGEDMPYEAFSGCKPAWDWRHAGLSSAFERRPIYQTYGGFECDYRDGKQAAWAVTKPNWTFWLLPCHPRPSRVVTCEEPIRYPQNPPAEDCFMDRLFGWTLNPTLFPPSGFPFP